MSSHTLQEMSMNDIVSNKDNARHIDEKSQEFLDIVTSIRAGGVQMPIHVWPHSKRKDKYEILDGERRWRACKNLKLKTIAAIVHRGITIQAAMILKITANKFRKKLKPLEEVAEIASCMDHLDSDAKLIAGLLGQTEQWVRLRANIHRNLIQEWRKAFLDIARYPLFKNWSVGHLTFIARLPASSQKELLSEITQRYWQWENVSVQDLAGRIGGSLMLLIKAKWNLDDDTLLPKAGACSDCTKRSGAEPVLWFGAADDQIKSKDRCLDPQCWKNKMQAYLQQRAKELSAKFTNLTYRATEHMLSEEKEILSKTFGRVFDPEDVQKSTRGSKGSIPSMVVHGTGAGMITFVKEKQFARPSGSRRTGTVTPLKDRRAMLKAKRWSQVLIELRKKVEAANVDQVIYKDKITGIMALAAIVGNHSIYPGNERTHLKEIDALVKSKNSKMALAYLWASVRPTLDNILTYGGPATQISQYIIDNAKWIAGLVQVDIDKIFKEVSQQKGFTEPKSWKDLNADGTPKKAKPKKAKGKNAAGRDRAENEAAKHQKTAKKGKSK
ncbi:Nucleoid occlusion protein [subsurface metagenome]